METDGELIGFHRGRIQRPGIQRPGNRFSEFQRGS